MCYFWADSNLQINAFSEKLCNTQFFLKERLVVSLATFEDMMHDLGNKNATFEDLLHGLRNKCLNQGILPK